MSTVIQSTRQAARTTTPSAPQATAGKVLTGLVALFLGFDAVTHLGRQSDAMEFSADIGAPEWFPVVCGAVLATCAVLVRAGAWPRDERLRALVRN